MEMVQKQTVSYARELTCGFTLLDLFACCRTQCRAVGDAFISQANLKALSVSLSLQRVG